MFAETKFFKKFSFYQNFNISTRSTFLNKCNTIHVQQYKISQIIIVFMIISLYFFIQTSNCIVAHFICKYEMEEMEKFPIHSSVTH